MPRHSAGTDAHDQSKVAHQSVIGPEHCGPETAREAITTATGQGADDFLVDLLVGDHRRGGVGVVAVIGASLEPLDQGQDEHRPEVTCQKRQDAGAQVRAPGGTDLITEQCQPVLFVAFLGSGDRGEDLAFLAVVALRQIAVDGRLGALIGQMSTPPAQISGGGFAARPHGPLGVHRVIMDRPPPPWDSAERYLTAIIGQVPAGAPEAGPARSAPGLAQIPAKH